MKNKSTLKDFWTDRSKVALPIAFLMLLASMGLHIMQNERADGLETSLANEQAESDRYEAAYGKSAQLLVETNERLSALQDELQQQETRRVDAERQYQEARERIRGLQAAQAGSDKWRTQAEKNQAENMELQRKLSDAKDRWDALNAENASLQRKAADMKEEMDRLAANRAFIDGSLTQAFRGNKERLTVLAKKARKLQVTLKLPPSVAKGATYTITTPEGQVIQGDDPSVSLMRKPEPGPSLASGGRMADPNGGEQLKLVYIPKKRLKPGLYKVEVRNNGEGIGTTYLSLR